MPRHVRDNDVNVRSSRETSAYSIKENDPLTSNLGRINLRDRQAQRCRQQERGCVNQARCQNGHLQIAEVNTNPSSKAYDAHFDPAHLL